MTLHPEYVVDKKGIRRKVLLSIGEFQERLRPKTGERSAYNFNVLWDTDPNVFLR